MELKIAALGQADRRNLPIHKSVKDAVSKAQREDEHLWQTAHRIIALGLKAAEEASAS